MKSLQQYADEMLDSLGLAEYKQPLKTPTEAFAALGWSVTKGASDRAIRIPKHLVQLTTEIGARYELYDPTTGNFMRDVTGPLGENFMAPYDVAEPERAIDPVRGSVPRCWITGTRKPNAAHDDPVELKFAPPETLAKEEAAAADVVKAIMEALFSAARGQSPAGVPTKGVFAVRVGDA